MDERTLLIWSPEEQRRMENEFLDGFYPQRFCCWLRLEKPDLMQKEPAQTDHPELRKGLINAQIWCVGVDSGFDQCCSTYFQVWVVHLS